MTDIRRAALIAFVQSIFPVLVIVGIADLKPDAISAIVLLVNNGITLGALLWKSGQGA